MKLLLDECVREKLRLHILGHDVFTVGYLGWKGLKNGALLRTAAEADFDALITVDQGILDQHNPATLPLTVIVLQSESDDLAALVKLMPDLQTALANRPTCAFLVISPR